MKAIINKLLLLAAILCITACEKQGDKIYLSSLEEGELVSSESEVALSMANSKQIVLSLAWNNSDLSVSNPSMQAPNLVSATLQASTSETFAENVLESVETSLSKAYTGSELNTLAKNLGLTPDVAVPVYFRLKSVTGNNMEPVYTNTVTVQITSYFIDMSIGYVLDSKQAETGAKLYSAASDGVYTGFMGATGWYNYYLREGDGTIWGNDGVDGSPFLISSEDTKWNMWFPQFGGCYFVNLNTTKKVWSALYIPELTVSGDLTGSLTFDRPNLKWTLVFNATQTGNITLQVSGSGKQYDYSTGTTDDAAKTTAVGFTQNGESLAFGQQSGNITVQVTSTGTNTLVIDLSNPQQWVAKVVGGSDTPTEVRQQIYLSGIDDLITGNWNFNNKLYLYDEDNQAYAGVAYASSEWGYNIFLEADNWDDKYTFASGDAYQGTMELKGQGGNLKAPATGLYFFDVSLKALTYKLVTLENKIYYSGVNDNWDLHDLNATATKGVFSGSVTIEKASKWGFQIILDAAWTYKYGGSNGKLSYKGSNITDDATLSPGTYTLTVDLINGTYALTK